MDGAQVDKDLLKGLLLIAGVIVGLSVLFIVVSESGPRKAECIASALKSGVKYANIDQTCGLTAGAR